ncbi:Unknown protein sequence [Pseudomonas syringae pv. maculicola]|nr:Unknown protein sequence [Pseudomonas syringae pv. maculicola]
MCHAQGREVTGQCAARGAVDGPNGLAQGCDRSVSGGGCIFHETTVLS